MNICIPTATSEGLGALVFGHFGSAPYFTIVNVESGDVRVLDNTNAHHSHGMCHPLGALSGLSINAVVCQGMGARAVQKLHDAGIKAFQAQGQTVAELIDRCKAKELSEITMEGACTQHGCH